MSHAIHALNQNSRSRVIPSKPARKVVLTRDLLARRRLRDAAVSQIRRRPYSKVRR